MLERIILFGAGNELTKIIEMLCAIKCKILFAVDNDIKKNGKIISGVRIYTPEKLLSYKDPIYITCIKDDEIKQQIVEMNAESRLISKESFLEKYIEKISQSIIPKSSTQINSSRTFLFDNIEKVGWGGVDRWNKMLAQELRNNGYDGMVLSCNHSEKIEEMVPHTNFLIVIKYVFHIIINNLPVCIINNWNWHVMIAAILAKKYFPDEIFLVSVIHSDEYNWIRKVSTYEKWFDSILCVSEEIARKVTVENDVSTNKVIYRANFVDRIMPNNEKKVELNEECVKIGYAGRLEKFQKRADLLIKLIDVLENSGIKYRLSIAGIGEYFEIIKQYLKKNSLEDKVILKGFVKPDDMRSFWKNQNFSINLSDSEGMSLSMLEAMAEGTIPIVTKVSGVDDIVISGYNGYIFEKNDLESIVNIINNVLSNKKHYYIISQRARNTIMKKCSKSEYAKFLVNLSDTKKMNSH